MDFIIDNWTTLFVLLILIGCVIAAIRQFLAKSTEQQIAQVKEWLLWAVTEAEKELGGGTGKLKLRQVYDLFVQRFPWLAKIVAFETFSGWVDEALQEMRKMLESNKAVQALVEGNK